MVVEKVSDGTNINYSFTNLLRNYDSLIARYSEYSDCTVTLVITNIIIINLKMIFKELAITYYL